MLKGLGDLGQIMKIQKEMKNVQKKITSARLEGESPNGSVKATVTGEYRLVDLQIDESLLNGSDAGEIKRSIMSAVNDAVAKIKDYSAGEMEKLTGGLNIPGLGNFLK